MNPKFISTLEALATLITICGEQPSAQTPDAGLAATFESFSVDPGHDHTGSEHPIALEQLD